MEAVRKKIMTPNKKMTKDELVAYIESKIKDLEEKFARLQEKVEDNERQTEFQLTKDKKLARDLGKKKE
jgi:hypothetical protein